MRGRRDLLDLFTKSAGELLDSYFESAPLKAVLGWDSVVGNFASPYTPGSAYVLLHHVFGEVNGKSGVWGHAIGGMGAISQAIAKECAARGVVVETDAGVEQVLVEHVMESRAHRRRAPAGRPRTAREDDRVQPQPETAVPEADRARTPRRRRRRTHGSLPLRLRHLPHERRPVRAAGLHRRTGHAAATAPPVGHPHRAVAAVFRAGVLRREVQAVQRRLVARADRRTGDLLDARRHARAARPARRQPVLPARAPEVGRRAGTRIATPSRS